MRSVQAVNGDVSMCLVCVRVERGVAGKEGFVLGLVVLPSAFCVLLLLLSARVSCATPLHPVALNQFYTAPSCLSLLS